MELCSKCGKPPAAGDKLRLCGRCHSVKYCTAICQGDHWSHVCEVAGCARDVATIELLVAAGTGRVAALKSLLKYGANVNSRIQGRSPITPAESDFAKRFTALYMAALKGHAAAVVVLLRAGAKVNKAGTDDGETALMVAALVGEEIVVAMLLRAGAALNKTCNAGHTALSRAAREGHMAVLKLLIEAGAKVDKADEHCITPLMSAAEMGHDAAVSVLLAAGVE